MDAMFCLLVGGTEEQQKSYMKDLEKVGEFTICKYPSEAITSIYRNEYIVSNNKYHAKLAKNMGCKITGVFFDDTLPFPLEGFDKVIHINKKEVSSYGILEKVR